MEGPVSFNHESLYFTDGNIVLGCNNETGGATYFRIHRSHLATQSSVFSDMLSLPARSEQQEMYDDLPLVKFPPSVDAQTMELFLGFFYCPTSHQVLKSNQADLAYKLFDVLVLADMLFVDKLKATIIDRIKEDWEIQSIQEWQRRFSILNSNSNSKTKKRVYKFYEPASAIRVARRFDPKFINPLQFFELSFRDWLLPYEPNRLSASESPKNPGARWDLLSPQDRKTAEKGRQQFLNVFLFQVGQLIREIDDYGPSDGPCSVSIDKGRLECQIALRERHEAIISNVLRGGHPFLEIQDQKINNNLKYVNQYGDEYDAIHAQCGWRWDHNIDRILENLFSQISVCYANP